MKLNRRIITVMVAVLALFLVMVVYLTYFIMFRADDITKSSYNPRIWEKEEKVLRGEIYDRNGVLLAESKKTDYGQKRIYPYKDLYAHTIGYNSRNYGKTNLELEYNSYLLREKSISAIEILRDREKEKEMGKGASLALTLDNSMTSLAAELLGNDNGSVVAINPVTGEVYCLYSNPSFDPNEDSLKANWNTISNDPNAPFVPRATQGLYAPGSTFKVVSAVAGINGGHGNYTTDDSGTTKVGGKEFKNASQKAYGAIGMEDAIKYSSNVYFTELSEKIGNSLFKETARKFLINEDVPFEIETKTASLDFDNLDSAHLASVAIGQGELLVTPLKMAMVACAIANDGVMMKPYMVEKAHYDDGEVIYTAQSEALSKATDMKTALEITDYMIECVKSGTGTAARVSGVTVAGKTGTAQNSGADHAWFIGFAPADNPQIAVCVMKENAGRGGGSVCAPVAARIIKYALDNGLITK